MKKNTNVLAGMQCPKCKSLGPFGINGATCTVTVTDDGVEDAVDYEWEKDAWCTCKACGFDEDGTSRVRDFKGNDEEGGDEAASV